MILLKYKTNIYNNNIYISMWRYLCDYDLDCQIGAFHSIPIYFLTTKLVK